MGPRRAWAKADGAAVSGGDASSNIREGTDSVGCIATFSELVSASRASSCGVRRVIDWFGVVLLFRDDPSVLTTCGSFAADEEADGSRDS